MAYQKFQIITLLFAGLLSTTSCDAPNEPGKQYLTVIKEKRIRRGTAFTKLAAQLNCQGYITVQR
jgi:hypothetical protein